MSGALSSLVGPFSAALAARGRARATVEGYRRALGAFAEWCRLQDVLRPRDVGPHHIEGYLEALLRRGRSTSHRAQQVTCLRGFFRWLLQRSVVSASPLEPIERPRVRSRLPETLSAAQVERALDAIDPDSLLGLRDRALFELLYSTAIRRAELVALDLTDVDLDQRLVVIRHGKGDRGRVVPLGERAASWLGRYLSEVRAFRGTSREVALFLSVRGRRLPKSAVNVRAQRHGLAAGLGRRLTPHVLRHTAATLMLERGADVRVIQELLGHESLDSTARYTRVTISALQSIHAATHPAEADAESEASAPRLPRDGPANSR